MKKEKINIKIYSDYRVTCPFDDDFFKKIANEVLKTVHFPFNSAEISLVITDDTEMKKINKEYRNIDNTTDVLSFPQNEGKNIESSLLGDIVISYDKSIAQAGTTGISVDREIAFLFIHGMLHLLGYDHETGEIEEKEMFKLQENILAKIIDLSICK